MSTDRPTIDEREAVFRQHLQAMGDAPLLTSGEELAAAATVADGRAAENELAALGGSTVTEINQIAALRERVANGDAARTTLIDSARRLVVSLARRHAADGQRSTALLAAGDEALSRAVDRYDPAGGLPFSAFARWWLERAMREVESVTARPPADATMLTALGHLHEDDCRVIELRMGLNGGPGLSRADTARVLGLELARQQDREERAVAKLRHPCTPGDLTHLKKL